MKIATFQTFYTLTFFAFYNNWKRFFFTILKVSNYMIMQCEKLINIPFGDFGYQ